MAEGQHYLGTCVSFFGAYFSHNYSASFAAATLIWASPLGQVIGLVRPM